MAEGSWTRRDFFRRSATAGAIVVAGPAALAGCSKVKEGNNSGEDAKKSGSITIGIAGEQPYGYTDEAGKLTGEAPEVARAVFANMGITDVKFEQVEFKTLIQGLAAKKFDVIAAGMNITPERCGNAAFSVPDYSALTAFLVAKGNPQGITTFDDIVAKKVKVAVLTGAVEKDYATDAGVAEDQLLPQGAQDDLLRSVLTGRAACAALTDISFKDVVRQNPDAAVEVTAGFDPVVKGKKVVSAGGFVFRKGDDQIREQFNAELTKLHENGEWVKITAPFGFSEANLPKPDVTTEKLCAAS